MSITGAKLKIDTIGSSPDTAAAYYDAILADAFYEAKITLDNDGDEAGIVVDFDGTEGWAVTLTAGSSSNGTLEISKVVNDGKTLNSPTQTYTATILPDTEHTLNVVKRQNTIYAWLAADPTINVSHENYSITEFGLPGLIATAANTTFDDYRIWLGAARESHGRRWRSSADTSIYDNSGAKSLQIDGQNHGGEVVFTGHADDDYIAQVSYTRNSGREGALYVRYQDADNWYRVLLDHNAGGSPKARLQLMLRGKLSTLDSSNYTEAATVTLKVKVEGTSIKSWVDGSPENDVTLASDELIPWGGVALSGWQAASTT